MRNSTLEAKLDQHKRHVDNLLSRIKAGHMRSAGIAAEMTQLANEIMEIHTEFTAPRERKPRAAKQTQVNEDNETSSTQTTTHAS